jgi:DNA-binding XRE family transcriptional regulator
VIADLLRRVTTFSSGTVNKISRGGLALGHANIIYYCFYAKATGFACSVEDHEEVIKCIGLRIAELRAEAGLTQAQVAEKLSMILGNYQRIEYGLQNLTIQTIVRIAGVLGVPSIALWENPILRKQPAKRGRPRKNAVQTRKGR